MTLEETFADLSDWRKGPAIRYSLSEITIMAICAILCGADNWVEVQHWRQDRREWLKERFGFDKGIPSHDPFGDLFGMLDAKQFEQRFRTWINRLAGVVGGVVALDGIPGGHKSHCAAPAAKAMSWRASRRYSTCWR